MIRPRILFSATLATAAVCLGLGEIAFAQSRGTQLTREGARVLANKDVGSERWALGLNEDGSATGNVFRLGGAPPAFLFCAPLGDSDFACSGADACVSGGQQRGIQASPDGRRILVNKDVGSERWAITLNLSDGTVTGNVFRSDGGPPAFLTCEPASGGSLDCYGSEECRSDRCIDGYTFIANVTLPSDFFTPPTPCGSQYTFIANVALPALFFVPNRPTLSVESLPTASLPSGQLATLQFSAPSLLTSLLLTFQTDAAPIGLVGLDLPDGPVTLDYTGEQNPASPLRPFRASPFPRGLVVVDLPQSPIRPARGGTHSVTIGNPSGSPAAVRGSLIVNKRPETSSGRLDLRFYFVAIDGISAATAPADPGVQAVLDALRSILANAAITIGQVSFYDYPSDRALELTVIDTSPAGDSDADGIADEAEELFALPRPMGNRTLDLFVIRDFIPAATIGFAGAIPGPALVPPGEGSGVIVALFAEFPSTPQQAVPLAQTIAHEAGHYLGLYHPTEGTGIHGDPLLDTPFCGPLITLGDAGKLDCPDVLNLMFGTNFVGIGAPQFEVTADQRYVLQRHPLVYQ